jgi:hypothetical protein
MTRNSARRRLQKRRQKYSSVVPDVSNNVSGKPCNNSNGSVEEVTLLITKDTAINHNIETFVNCALCDVVTEFDEFQQSRLPASECVSGVAIQQVKKDCIFCSICINKTEMVSLMHVNEEELNRVDRIVIEQMQIDNEEQRNILQQHATMNSTYLITKKNYYKLEAKVNRLMSNQQNDYNDSQNIWAQDVATLEHLHNTMIELEKVHSTIEVNDVIERYNEIAFNIMKEHDEEKKQYPHCVLCDAATMSEQDCPHPLCLTPRKCIYCQTCRENMNAVLRMHEDNESLEFVQKQIRKNVNTLVGQNLYDQYTKMRQDFHVLRKEWIKQAAKVDRLKICYNFIQPNQTKLILNDEIEILNQISQKCAALKKQIYTEGPFEPIAKYVDKEEKELEEIWLLKA